MVFNFETTFMILTIISLPRYKYVIMYHNCDITIHQGESENKEVYLNY